MKKIIVAILWIVPLALFGWAAQCLLSAPDSPPLDWRAHMTADQYNAVIQQLMIDYRNAAYIVTWAVQLAYVGWLGVRWTSLHNTGRKAGKG